MIKLLYNGESSFEYIGECHENYREYLLSIKDIAPRSAYEFAAAEWHYDPSDRRCPHDAKITSVSMTHGTEGELEIRVDLTGKWHDDEHVLIYKNVEYYDLQKQPFTGIAAGHFKRPHSDHGDWLIDEMHISSEGLVVHEIEFAFARWIIHCADIEFSWIPKGAEDDSPKATDWHRSA